MENRRRSASMVLLSVANWKAATQRSDTSKSLALFLTLSSEGSNQSAKASRALSIASCSESPAEAQPGSSGKTADQRLARGSNSTSNLNFIGASYAERREPTMLSTGLAKPQTLKRV